MISRFRKGFLIGAAVLGLLWLSWLAYSRPGYLTSQIYLGGLLGLEFLVAAVWMYRRIFPPIVIVAFLFAGVDLPVGFLWTLVGGYCWPWVRWSGASWRSTAPSAFRLA